MTNERTTVDDVQSTLDRIAKLATHAHIGMSDRKRTLFAIRTIANEMSEQLGNEGR